MRARRVANCAVMPFLISGLTKSFICDCRDEPHDRSSRTKLDGTDFLSCSEARMGDLEGSRYCAQTTKCPLSGAKRTSAELCEMSAPSIMASGHAHMIAPDQCCSNVRKFLRGRRRTRGSDRNRLQSPDADLTNFNKFGKHNFVLQTELPAGRSCAPLKKCHRADFDAFARPRMRRGGGILERGVRGPARAAVLHRIKHLEYIGLLAPHAREPVPLVFRIILDRIGLADASGRAPL